MHFQQLQSRQAYTSKLRPLISVLKTEITNWPWILPQLTTKSKKFFNGFYLLLFLQNPSSFLKKITFYTFKKIFQSYILISKFQVTFAFFLMNKSQFCLPKSTPIKLAHEKGHYHEISKTYQNLFVDIWEIPGIVQNETQFDYRTGIPVKCSKLRITNHA